MAKAKTTPGEAFFLDDLYSVMALADRGYWNHLGWPGTPRDVERAIKAATTLRDTLVKIDADQLDISPDDLRRLLSITDQRLIDGIRERARRPSTDSATITIPKETE